MYIGMICVGVHGDAGLHRNHMGSKEEGSRKVLYVYV